jgi:hypothetical protein
MGLVLCGVITAAHSAEAIGTVKRVDGARRVLILTDGSVFVAHRHVELSAFTVGEKVTVSYAKRGNEMDITSIRPAVP